MSECNAPEIPHCSCGGTCWALDIAAGEGWPPCAGYVTPTEETPSNWLHGCEVHGAVDWPNDLPEMRRRYAYIKAGYREVKPLQRKLADLRRKREKGKRFLATIDDRPYTPEQRKLYQETYEGRVTGYRAEASRLLAEVREVRAIYRDWSAEPSPLTKPPRFT